MYADSALLQLEDDIQCVESMDIANILQCTEQNSIWSKMSILPSLRSPGLNGQSPCSFLNLNSGRRLQFSSSICPWSSQQNKNNGGKAFSFLLQTKIRIYFTMLFPADTLGSLDNQTESKANTKKQAKKIIFCQERSRALIIAYFGGEGVHVK